MELEIIFLALNLALLFSMPLLIVVLGLYPRSRIDKLYAEAIRKNGLNITNPPFVKH